MTAPVPGQKGNAHVAEPPKNESVTRIAERSVHLHFFDVFESLHAVEAAAADDPDFRPRVHIPTTVPFEDHALSATTHPPPLARSPALRGVCRTSPWKWRASRRPRSHRQRQWCCVSC